ncbi:MAG: ribosomal subunit interface protein [Candidatus Omnitrophica bacterium CG1_02_46_14]|nr:MAG: ribosomal subunit interface protein [Candidatus Omnitrophica bacterium CG1_02_46_14]
MYVTITFFQTIHEGRTMNIDISGRHFHVSDALKDTVTEKLKKLDKYSLSIETIHVVLEVQKFHHICEITAAGKNLRTTAKEVSTDMYAAFDSAMGNLQLQLGRQHDRVKDHKGSRYQEETETPQDTELI